MNFKNIMKKQVFEKIIKKKEFSRLPRKEVELAFRKFDKEKYIDEEKVKLTRNLLRKVFSAFTSQKILSLKDKTPEWVLRKHMSTRERLAYYNQIYQRILPESENITIFDLGAGVNGFSYNYFKNTSKVKYIAIEAIGQLVDLMNYYFVKEKFNAKAIHLSLFELDKVKKIIKNEKKPRIVFLFKTIDSLEILQRDYSKKLILEISKLVEKIIVSFATKSMGRKRRFRVKRTWIISFIEQNFKVLDDFELAGERYLIFKSS